jgi:asparagine synthase (glutamine-hydrolysing)
MFIAPGDSFYAPSANGHGEPEGGSARKMVNQLLSPESIRHAGYFDADAVQRWRKQYSRMWKMSMQRTSIEMGLAAVASTQLWHHLYVDGRLTEAPASDLAMGHCDAS